MVKKVIKKGGAVKNPKIIGLDLDGVIIDHTKMKIQLAKKRGFNLKPKDAQSEKIKSVLPLPHRRLIQYFLYSHPLLALQAPLIPMAKRGLEKIKQSKIPYFLISRRREPELAIKLLRRHSLWPRYFHPKNTFFVIHKEEKDEIAKRFGITHYVDDETEVLGKITSVKHRFLFDPYNAFRKTPYVRVANWPKLVEKILEL
jgi:uncharacterized HAD superfamily protein